MIHGDKPSGYFSTFDERGLRVEGETRQCAHCQFMWQYAPGSGRRYGLCMCCKGIICGRAECLKDQAEKKAILQAEQAKTHDCIPFEEWNYHLMEKAARAEAHLGKLGQGFIMEDSGLIVPNTNG